VNGDDLGYGLFVNGIEVQGTAGPLLVRYIDPGSPAATAGIVRGDEITSINGVPAATVIANNDYSALTSNTAGQTVTVATHNASGDHTITLTSVVYPLTPVQGTRIVTSPGGHAMGYLMVTDMIDQALAPYDAAFAQFKAAAVQDVVIDLRYMGSGFVNDGEIMASYPAAPTTTGQVYARLFYNALTAPNLNSFYTFDPFNNALGLSRVFVLTGPRTCAAAEQLVNGLSPYVGVITLGDTTCGKPVGSNPVSNCGTTYSPVTFQITNANNQGQYFTGLAATCPVAEDMGVAIGADTDPLLAGAEHYADSGACPPPSLLAATSASRHRSALLTGLLEPGRRGSVSR
jgi:C-terminal processing protease CtpA/Prc